MFVCCCVIIIVSRSLHQEESTFLSLVYVGLTYPGEVKQPATIFIDSSLVYIVEYDSYRISMFDTNGSFVDCFGTRPHPDNTLLTAVCSLFFYLTPKL